MALISYNIIGSHVCHQDEGVVTENKCWIEKDGNGYVDYNKITIKRADGSIMQYDNQDDLIIWKRNSDKLRDFLQKGTMVRVKVNLHRNITAVIPITNVTETVEQDD